MNVLVTGGAGYIGSIMVKRLLDEGYGVTVVDSLERGYQDFIDQRATFVKGDLKDKSFTQNVFNQEYFCVIHFAGFISMEESTKNPFIYFQNNTFATLNILESLKNVHKK